MLYATQIANTLKSTKRIHAMTLTVYYDGSCPLCRAEINTIREVAPEGALTFIDCSVPGFDDAAAHHEGVSQDDMMQALHVRDSAGHWFKGVDAFVQLYGYGGLPQLSRLWAHPVIYPVMTRIYPWVVRNRYWLSSLGLPAATDALIRFNARRAHRNSRLCENGECSLEER